MQLHCSSSVGVDLDRTASLIKIDDGSILMSVMAARERRLLSTREAAEQLGVKPASLYAYVSRGLLARQRVPGDRGSWFDPAAVDRLATRGRGAAAAAARTRRELRIESAVTSIDPAGHSYRGRSALELAAGASFERVAELLWTGTLPSTEPRWIAEGDQLAIGRAVQRVLSRSVLPFDRLRLVTAALASADPFRHDLRPEAVALAARRLLVTLVETLPARRPAAARPRLAARLWSRLSSRAPSAVGVALLDAALVLLADHELAGSTLAVRIAAAYRADPYGAIGAGFGVLGGALHGAASLAAEAMLADVAGAGDPAPVIDRTLRRGERLPGLGHPLYPGGDPRAACLLDLLRRGFPRAPRLRRIEALVAATRARGFPPPNVDLAVAAVTHVLDLPRGTGELIFALARIAGWVAHALEEYEHPSPLRLRAIYVGPTRDFVSGRGRTARISVVREGGRRAAAGTAGAANVSRT
jgi:citrate synthase